MKYQKSEEMWSSSISEKDMISTLPEVLINEILSHLSMRDTARTSVLSKVWKKLWDLYPYLHFDRNQFRFLPYQQFRSCIDKKLSTHQEQESNILKFTLCMSTIPIYENGVEDINRWINTVIERGVKEVDLQLDGNSIRTLYRLPLNVYAAKRLTVLKLKNIELSLCGNIKLSELKTLSLEGVVLEDQRVIDQLLTACHLIMELRIVKCYNLKDLKLSDLPELKMVEVGSCSMIESTLIQVPGLEKLIISEFESYEIIRDDEFCMNLEVDSKTSETLRELTICNSNMKGKTFRGMFSECSNLESLVLHNCKKIFRISVSSQKLRSLVIRKCINIVAADIIAPNLTSFTNVTSQRPYNFLDISHLRQYMLDQSCRAIYTIWLQELKIFERKFHKAEGQKLVIFPTVCKYFDAILLEDWCSMAELSFETVTSVPLSRLIITNVSFSNLANHMFCYEGYSGYPQKLLAISLSESKIYEVLKKNPNYSIEYCSSVVLAKAEAKKYSRNTYWRPFSAQSIRRNEDYWGSFYEALLVAGKTATLNATLLSVK